MRWWSLILLSWQTFSLGNGREVFISDCTYAYFNRYLKVITRKTVEMGRGEKGCISVYLHIKPWYGMWLDSFIRKKMCGFFFFNEMQLWGKNSLFFSTYTRKKLWINEILWGDFLLEFLPISKHRLGGWQWNLFVHCALWTHWIIIHVLLNYFSLI